MFQEISIKNFGLIESLQLDFRSGFHAISGETGAGKSILLQAIAFVLGSRVDKDWLRADCPEAVVSLLVETESNTELQSQLIQQGFLSAEETSLILRRSLGEKGRSRAYLNDQNISLKSLQQIGEGLCHLVGQHAAQKLLHQAYLRELLDQVAQHPQLLANYQEAYQAHRQALRSFEELQARVKQIQEQEDFLRFQYEELREARLKPGEEEELQSLKQRLKNSTQLNETTYKMLELLSEGEHSVLEQVGKLQVLDKKLFQWEGQNLPWEEQVVELAEKSQELLAQLQHYHASLPSPEEDLDAIESRLDVLQKLQKKYRLDLSGLMTKLDQLKIQLGEVEDFEQLLKEHQHTLEKNKKALEHAAQQLFQSRQKAAQKIVQQLAKVLKDLAMPQTQIKWQFERISQVEEFHEQGGDKMCFEVSFNPGEPLKELAQVASGGELSRLLLALYEILFQTKKTTTLIFDEVDSGVGGSVAELIGKKLRALGERSQVLAVTHLAQIASQAQWHYFVTKKVQNKRTVSEIFFLEGEKRLQEIARMIAGVQITPQALEHAKQLLGNFAA